MSHLRHDPVQKRWVIVASETTYRPSTLPGELPRGCPTDPGPAGCPFCPGNEASAPQVLWRSAGPSQVRVVPHRFPALAIEGELGRAAHGHYDRLNGIGAHEVIIEGRDHTASLGELSADVVQAVLRAWRDRMVDLYRDHRLRYVLLFENHGWAAGAQLLHPHSQLIATPVTPRTVAIELESAREHYLAKERCLFCDLLRQELSEQARIVVCDERFVTLCPYASRFPFEMHVFPRVHRHDFGAASDDDLLALARHLKDVLRRMSKALGDPAYNLVLHTAPNPHSRGTRPHHWTTLESDWHWHLEILPRVQQIAGFEWGSGIYLNPTAPELAAQVLREVP